MAASLLPHRDVADVGTGPAVVFSHGTLLDRTMFAPQTAALAERYRTIAYTSRAGTSRYGTERCLDDLVATASPSSTRPGSTGSSSWACRWAGSWPSSWRCGTPDDLGARPMATQADAYTAEEHRTYGGLLGPLDTEGPSPSRPSRPSVR